MNAKIPACHQLGKASISYTLLAGMNISPWQQNCITHIHQPYFRPLMLNLHGGPELVPRVSLSCGDLQGKPKAKTNFGSQLLFWIWKNCGLVGSRTLQYSHLLLWLGLSDGWRDSFRRWILAWTLSKKKQKTEKEFYQNIEHTPFGLVSLYVYVHKSLLLDALAVVHHLLPHQYNPL